MTAVIDSFTGEYDFLSNFHPSPVCLGTDRSFRATTVEHAFQALKTADLEEQLLVLTQPTPGKAKRAGRKVTMRGNWNVIRDGVMYDLLSKKFEDPILKEKLLATGDAELIEGNDWGDTYWGKCKGEGENILGILLMQVRVECGGFGPPNSLPV